MGVKKHRAALRAREAACDGLEKHEQGIQPEPTTAETEVASDACLRLQEGAQVIDVLSEDEGTRADAVLAKKLAEAPTRSRVQRAIRDGGVLFNGVPLQKLSTKLKKGDRLIWLRDACRDMHGAVEPEPIPLHIYHEDDSCIVLLKPAGMTVHPAGGLRSGTLVNALLHHLPCAGPVQIPAGGTCSDDDADSDCETNAHASGHDAGRRDLQSDPTVLSETNVRPGIVHRLDRGTSGVMVVAKHEAAHAAIMGQFADRKTKRTYVAIVWGVPQPREGTVVSDIGRDPGNRLRMAVVASGKGKNAITHYSVVEELDSGHAALVRFRLETGRTHQIRVHARHMGHPLLGDAIYNGAQMLRGPSTPERVKRYAELFREGGILARPALHAETLGFAHPRTGEWLTFQSDLPADMAAAIKMLR